MPQQSLSQVRVIDPILTEVARGYTSQKAAIADALFPVVSVNTRAGRILKFDADSFKLVTTARAPGSNTKRIGYGYGSDAFALVDHRLEGTVPRELQEEASNGPGIDLAANAVRRVQDMMALEREKQAADLARDPSKYAASNKVTLSGTSQWSNTASNPFTDIIAAAEAIRAQIGEYPNVLAIGPAALAALRTHAKVLDRMSTATDRPPATMAQLANLFEIPNIVVGRAIYQNTAGALVDVWGKDVILGFTTPKSAQDMGSPSYGYTYRLEGRPWVEEGYYEPNPATWNYPVSDAYQPVLAGPSAGFLITNAVA